MGNHPLGMGYNSKLSASESYASYWYAFLFFKVQLELSVPNATKKFLIDCHSKTICASVISECSSCRVFWLRQYEERKKNREEGERLSQTRLYSLKYNVERDESFPVKIEFISGAVSVYFEKTYRTHPNA